MRLFAVLVPIASPAHAQDSAVLPTGRGVTLAAGAAAAAWSPGLARLDQKIDVEKVLPKLRAIATKLTAGGV